MTLPTITVNCADPGKPISRLLYGVSTVARPQGLNKQLQYACRDAGFTNMRIQLGSVTDPTFLVKVVDGVSTVISVSDFCYMPDTSFDVRIQQDAQNIDVSINNVRVLSAHNEQYVRGRIGVFSCAAEQATFSSVKMFDNTVSLANWVNRVGQPIESELPGQHWSLCNNTLVECSAVDYSSFRIALSSDTYDIDSIDLQVSLLTPKAYPAAHGAPCYQGYLGIAFGMTDWRNGYLLYVGSSIDPLSHTNNPWQDSSESVEDFVNATGCDKTLVLNYPKASLGSLESDLYVFRSPIQFVELGNEIPNILSGDAGFPVDHNVTGSRVAKDLRHYRDFLKQLRPEATLSVPVADGYRVGAGGQQYFQQLLSGDADALDCLSLHVYPGTDIPDENKLAVAHALEHAYCTERGSDVGLFAGIREELQKYMPVERADSVKMIVSEYQLHGTGMVNAVSTADMLGVFARNNVQCAQLHGLGADATGWSPFSAGYNPYPVANTIALLSHNLVGNYITPQVVDSPTYSVAAAGLIPSIPAVPHISAHACRNPERNSMWVLLVNRDMVSAHEVCLKLENCDCDHICALATIYSCLGYAIGNPVVKHGHPYAFNVVLPPLSLTGIILD